MKQYFYNERTHRLHIKGYCKESKILPYHVRWFDTYDEARNYEHYLKTRFVRFLIGQVAVSQHITKGCFAFVPSQDFTKPWTDEELYTKYGLNDEEIAFIEDAIRPMELEGDN